MLALPPFHVTTLHALELKLPPSLARDLDLYRRLYKEAYGADVSEADLVREIVRAFLDREEVLRQHKHGAIGRQRPPRGRDRSTGQQRGSSPTSDDPEPQAAA